MISKLEKIKTGSYVCDFPMVKLNALHVARLLVKQKMFIVFQQVKKCYTLVTVRSKG